MELIDLAATYELPAQLAVDETVLGRGYPIMLAGLAGELIMPSLTWARGETPTIVAPDVLGLPSWLQAVASEDGEPIWGSASAWNRNSRVVETVWLSTIALRFANVSAQGINYSEAVNRRCHPEGALIDNLLAAVPAWFEAVRAWTSVLSG